LDEFMSPGILIIHIDPDALWIDNIVRCLWFRFGSGRCGVQFNFAIAGRPERSDDLLVCLIDSLRDQAREYRRSLAEVPPLFIMREVMGIEPMEAPHHQ